LLAILLAILLGPFDREDVKVILADTIGAVLGKVESSIVEPTLG
jgi:hypothetical protein